MVVAMKPNRWRVTISRKGKPSLRLSLPTLNEALQVARVDAAWFGDTASVHVSPILPETKGA
jgi:hypothetical protein